MDRIQEDEDGREMRLAMLRMGHQGRATNRQGGGPRCFVVIFYILFGVKYSILCRVCQDAGYMRVYTGGRSMSVRAGCD